MVTNSNSFFCYFLFYLDMSRSLTVIIELHQVQLTAAFPGQLTILLK